MGAARVTATRLPCNAVERALLAANCLQGVDHYPPVGRCQNGLSGAREDSR